MRQAFDNFTRRVTLVSSDATNLPLKLQRRAAVGG
jgi:hypothetical protein